MENEIEIHPVVLPATADNLGSLTAWEAIGWVHSGTRRKNKSVVGFHLYLVSDREIKEGDWILSTIEEVVIKVSKELEKKIGNSGRVGIKKIEATTDPSLGLPLIPQSFIEEYVQKQGKIERARLRQFNTLRPVITMENEVIILPTKDSWNRDELKQSAINAINWYRNWIRPDKPFSLNPNAPEFNKWFDKNY